MNDQVALIFTLFLYGLIIAVLARSVLSFFPVSRSNEFARLLESITEPLLGPVRRLLPRSTMFDLSGMVVIVVLYVMIAVVKRAANA